MKALFSLTLCLALFGSVWAETPAKEADEAFAKRLEFAKSAALEMYPEIADRNSPIAQECERLIEMLKKENDPILQSPLSPMFITALAASNVGAKRVFKETPPEEKKENGGLPLGGKK